MASKLGGLKSTLLNKSCSYQKILGNLIKTVLKVAVTTFGPKSVEKRPQQGNFFELTTPNMHLPSSKWNSTVKASVKCWCCYWEKKYFTALVVTHHPTADTTVIHTPPPIIPTTIPHHHQQLVRTADTTTQTLAVAGKLIISQNRKFQGGLARNLKKRAILFPAAWSFSSFSETRMHWHFLLKSIQEPKDAL